MTKHYAVEMKLHSKSGVPANDVVNTFSVVGPDAPTGPQFDTLEAAVMRFYNHQATGAANALRQYLSGSINQTGHAINIYRRPDAPGSLGSPVKAYAGLGFDTAPAGSIPEEVACCMSLQTDLVLAETAPGIDSSIPTSEAARDAGAPEFHSGHDRLQSRFRGRIYLGPFNSGVLATDTNGRSEPLLSFRTDLTLIAEAFVADLGADWGWEVFSRRAWAGSLVTHGYIDDAWDTQRRRGQKATTRTTFVL